VVVQLLSPAAQQNDGGHAESTVSVEIYSIEAAEGCRDLVLGPHVFPNEVLFDVNCVLSQFFLAGQVTAKGIQGMN
jgi:hypothetical protein